MNKKKGTSATKAKNKYNAKKYDRLYPYVKKGKKSIYKATASKIGKNLNQFIENTLDEKCKEINGEDGL